MERIKWPTACVVVGTTRAATCSSGFLAVIALLPVWEWFMELVMASKDLSKIFQGARLDPITYQRKMISLLGLGALPFAIFLSNPFCFPSRPVSLQEAVGAGHVLLLCPLLWLLWLWVYLSCCPALGPRSPPSPRGGAAWWGSYINNSYMNFFWTNTDVLTLILVFFFSCHLLKSEWKLKSCWKSSGFGLLLVLLSAAEC